MKARPFSDRRPAALALAAVLLMHAVFAALLHRLPSGAAGEGGLHVAPAGPASTVLMLWTESAPPAAMVPGELSLDELPPVAVANADADATEPAAALPAGAMPIAAGDEAGQAGPAIAPDRPALALTAPDLRELALWPTSGAPVRLRLHIDATGRVVDVVVLECAEADRLFAQALVQVLLATPHVPARHAGADVASVKEIELQFAPPAGPATATAPAMAAG